MRTEQAPSTIARDSTPDQFYVTGGTLPTGAPSYVIRTADTDLYESLRKGEFCYVLNTRQMGKSSLMIRTANRLRADGNAIAILDLTAVGQNLSADQWYNGMLTLLGDQLNIEDELDAFWQSNTRLGPMQRLMEAIRQIVLARLSNSGSALVVFVDEIDAVRSLPFSADEFFAGIRECYNRRTQDREFERLTFCLLGVATPADLILESRMSPFNIGRRIVVTDFTATEAAPLARGVPGGAAVLDRVLYWTGGHPYLTQRICKALSSKFADADICTAADVDQLCSELFLSKTARETDDNLAFVQNRLLKSEVDIAAMLDVYSDVIAGKRVVDDETNSIVPVLRLSGVVRVQDGLLRVRNRIYSTVFDAEWVLAHMPHAEVRRQRIAYRRGLLRAALVSAGVVLVTAVLAGVAELNAERANHLRQQANVATKTAEINEKRAEHETTAARNAQKEADDNAQKARDSAMAAFDEAVRADNNEKEVLSANRKVTELAAQRKHALDDRQAALLGAISARQRAADEARNANRLLYIANMNLAQQAYDNNNIARVLDLLKETDAGPAHAFEWGYWQRQCHLDLFTLRGHTNHVTSVVYFPDGRHVATASFDHSVRIWDTLTGRQVQRIPAQTNRPISCLSLSLDGSRLAIGSFDQTIEVFDMRYPGRLLRTLQMQGSAVLSVALNRNGTRLAAVGGDQRASAAMSVFNVDTGWNLHTERFNMPTFTGVAYSPNGKMIAAGGTDRIVRVWDADSFDTIHQLVGHKSTILCVAFSPDSKSLASGSNDNTARIWDIDTEQSTVTLTGHTQPIGGIAYSSDGAWIATAGYDNVARIWDSTTGQHLLTLKGHTDPVSAVAFSPDGSRLATASFDNTARIWESTRRRDTLTLRGHTGPVQDVAISKDGKTIYSGSSDGTLRVWSVQDGRQIGALISQKALITALSVSPDGLSLAAGTTDGTVELIDLHRRQVRKIVKLGSQPISTLGYSPDGSVLSVSTGLLPSSRGNGLYLLNSSDASIRNTLSRDQPAILGAAFSSEGSRLLTGGADNRIRIWSCSDGKQIRVWDASKSADVQASSFVTSVAFSPDGTKVAGSEGDQTGSGDNTARIWDATTGQSLVVLRGHANSLYSVAWSPDGKRLVTGSADKTARLWDAITGREVLTLKGHDNVVLKCLFSTDGNRIVTCSSDDTIKVWDRLPDTVGTSIKPQAMKH